MARRMEAQVKHPENLRVGRTYTIVYCGMNGRNHARKADFIEMTLVIGSRELVLIFERDDCLISIPWKNVVKITR